MLLRMKEEDYVCGDAIPADSGLVIRRSLSCGTDIETAYYAAASTCRHILPNVCIYCGTADDLLDDNDPYIADLYELYSVVRPICRGCKERGHEAKTWGKRFF